MSTVKLRIKGGYGEHGRSCFLVEYGREGHCYMVDCGIMDTDPYPYPSVTREELEKVDYIFMTHCHKDHSGAFSYFVENGFSGILVASAMTLCLGKIQYQRTHILCESPFDHVCGGGDIEFGELRAEYGRSGHCPGGLWFKITDETVRAFFSGDYQEDSLFYACDAVKDQEAELAVIDCAHNHINSPARELRENITARVSRSLAEGRNVIFPVPQYGRGLELFYMLKQAFPQAAVCVGRGFADCAGEMLKETWWYREGPLKAMQHVLADTCAKAIIPGQKDERGYDILLLADTHLKKKENAIYVREAVLRGSDIMVTGRVKCKSPVEQLLEEGAAFRCHFPHHQSRTDMEKMINENHFHTILPFHNNEREIIVRA